MVFGQSRRRDAPANDQGIDGYEFTRDCADSLTAAREEALRLGHEFVGTEHILLGLVRREDGGVARLLASLGLESHQLRTRVETAGRREHGGRKSKRRQPFELPYTSRARKALELAAAETQLLGQPVVGPEHVLLGLIAEERGLAARVLDEFGLSLETARAVVRGSRARPIPGFQIELDDASSLSIHEQIVVRVREAIATDSLAPGDRLPTVRQLADQLGIAPGTVARAYAELERLGVVVAEGARGTHVAARRGRTVPPSERLAVLVGLLRPVVVAAFHLGATADEVREALSSAMRDILERSA